MLKFFFIATALLFIGCDSTKTVGAKNSTTTAENVEKGPAYFVTSIDSIELKKNLFIYASDDFGGRETGTEGQKKAVEYLTQMYRSMGIMAAKGNGDYLQKVPLTISSLPEGNAILNGSEFKQGEHILGFAKAVGNFDNVVYVGYGVEDEAYSDYKMDVKGKVVLAKAGEPMGQDGNYIVSGNNTPSVWSNMSEAIGKKQELAFEKGAKGFLYFDKDNYSRYSGAFNRMKTSNNERMEVAADGDQAFLLLLDETSALALHPQVKEDTTPKALNVAAQFSLDDPGAKLESENVVAMIKGSSKPNEYVIISSHLDHIGTTSNGEINNGADDDGSGTVAMLEIAQAFKKAKDEGKGPARSVVFLHVTGEEKGLLGSQYYTDNNPIVPLDNTVANLNIDMIGRIDPKRNGNREYIYLIGSDKLSTELHNISEEINSKFTGLELDYKYNDENDPNRFYYRSDHYNFAKNNIPVIFYFNGTHDDYHRPSDTPDKINYDLLETRSRLIFHTAWELANREKRIVVDKAANQ